MSKIKPLFDYLLIEPLEKETTLPSGIVIPDSAKEKTQEGRVAEVGKGKIDTEGKKVEMIIKKGDVVIYKWGTEVKINGKDMLLVRQEDILATIES